MLNKIKSYFKRKSVSHTISCELSFKQLEYLESVSEYAPNYIHETSTMELMTLIRSDLKAIQQGKTSQYLICTSISASKVCLMLNFEQLSLLYLPTCLIFPDWGYLENKGPSSMACLCIVI